MEKINTHTVKAPENKRQSMAHEVSQHQNDGGLPFQFADNRPEAIAQRKLQALADNSLQAKKGAKWQAMANNYAARPGLINVSPGLAGVAQRVSLSNANIKSLKSWAKKEDAEDSEIEGLLEWLGNAENIISSDISSLLKISFNDWSFNWASVDPGSVSAGVNWAKPPTAVKAKVVGALAEVKKQISKQGLDPALFSVAEMQAIEAGKADGGWAATIQSVNLMRLDRIQNARLRTERTAKYTPAKTAGDLVFPAGSLVRAIWDYSFAVAVSGNAGPNDTLPGLHTDALINAAAALWHRRANFVPVAPANPVVPAAESVTDFHLPGGGTGIYIQDKSTRPVNPDPNRGRQADFICDWGNVTINVHVDATPQH